jgi:hypothetical protein
VLIKQQPPVPAFPPLVLGTRKMIYALFWFTGLAVWIWIIFISLLAAVVAVENRFIVKRSRAGASPLDLTSSANAVQVKEHL